MFHDRSKHIDVRYHYIRECIEHGKIVVGYITTELQLGDILIKALGHVHFQELRARIDVKELSGELIKA